MEIMELLKSRRTYRRFEQKPVGDNIVNDEIDRCGDCS